MTTALDSYRQIIRNLSDRLVEAQRPIRVLDSIKWDAEVRDRFFASRLKEQPVVDRSYYESRPLPFDPGEKHREFQQLERDIQQQLGNFNPLGVIMRRMCREYDSLVRMLEARGLPEFSRLSQHLYGSADDAFHAGDPTLADLGAMMGEALENLDRNEYSQNGQAYLTGNEVVTILQERLAAVFPDPARPVRVMLSDGIVSDAAAGSDYIKIRGEARFTERDVRLLEIHEGWVHVGTTLNGMTQPVCTFLSKGPPSSTVTQEGLAILMEVMALASYPERVRRLTNRIRAIGMAQQGATFLDVFGFFREQGLPDDASYTNASRVFRGSTPEGGPFTKDIVYSKGFVQIYNYLLLAVRKGLLNRIPLLFCGKTTLEDMRTLAQLVEEGMIEPPSYLPPLFADLSSVTAWMCYSSFLSRQNPSRIEADYANLF